MNAPIAVARSPVGILLALLLLSGGCAARSEPRAGPAAAPRRVGVVEVKRAHRTAVTEVVGTVRATRSATLAPLIGGTVAEIRVGLGSAVRTGDVLVRLAARDVDARLEQTRAVSALAERDRARATLLKEQGVISVAQFEAALSQWNVARARQAEASSVAERTVLRAPFGGVITAKLASVGDTALPGQPLLVIETPHALRFEAQVPERAGEDLVVGDRLHVRVEGVDRDLEGRIAEIQPAADDATRTRLFKIDLPDTPGLRAGRFGRVLVSGGQSVAVTIPSGAIVRRGQLETVFVIESGVAHLRLVRSGREADGGMEISSGLSGGEFVVVAEAADLVEGQRVEETR
jgi:RND family efflux transporter MFP subunit